MLINFLLLLCGLAILIISAKGLLEGSISIAKKLKISPLIVGLTIVAFGTSAPELIINILSVKNNHADIALGNILGANITNILFVLGICATIHPIANISKSIKKEILIAIGSMIILWIIGNEMMFSTTRTINHFEGLILLSLLISFIILSFKEKKEAKKLEGNEYSWTKSILFLIGSGLGLYAGGELLIANAVTLARASNISESFISLSIISIGTTFPELITSITASLQKQNNIALGNVIGSIIFNTWGILGTSAAIFTIPFSKNINTPIFIGIGSGLLLLIFFIFSKKQTLHRWQGIILLVLYSMYIGYLLWKG